MTNPTYTKRDSATAKLRKLGVDKAQYNDYIMAITDQFETDTFVVLVDKLERDRAKAAKPAEPTAKPKKTAKPAVDKPTRLSVSSVAQQAILAGKDNVSVWRELCATFPNLTEKQKYYPAWYRSYLRRNGKLQEK